MILFFALVTRFEPSVLRASAMAALAVTATTVGRPASSIRVLALAVAGLVVLDPFLVRSVRFQLSVGACIGIAVLSPRIGGWLRGPRSVVEPLSITLVAQAGVAPVLVAVFGGVPVAGVPANLLAGPVAGPVMIWGLAGGLLAGAIGGSFAVAAQWPTHVMISWIAWVAHRRALLPLGELQARELVVVAAGAMCVGVANRFRLTTVRRAGMACVVVALIAPALALRAPPPLRTGVAAGATLWRADAAVLELDGRVEAEPLLESLRRAGVSGLDVVVAHSAGPRERAAIDSLRHRYGIRRVLLPSNVRDETSISVGGLHVDARRDGVHLLVDITLVEVGSAIGRPV